MVAIKERAAGIYFSSHSLRMFLGLTPPKLCALVLVLEERAYVCGKENSPWFMTTTSGEDLHNGPLLLRHKCVP